MDFLDVECPHCSGHIIVAKDELNCRIFRHGMFRNGRQIPPHASKVQIDRWKPHILGCGGPFKIVGDIAVMCEYI